MTFGATLSLPSPSLCPFPRGVRPTFRGELGSRERRRVGEEGEVLGGREKRGGEVLLEESLGGEDKRGEEAELMGEGRVGLEGEGGERTFEGSTRSPCVG